MPEPLSAAALSRLRTKLEQMRESFANRAVRITDDSLGEAMQDSLGDLSSYDNHPADQGSETFEREKDLGLKLDAAYFRGEVEDALVRMDAGTYGLCQRCGRPIGTERLEAVPYTRLCVDCKRAEESAVPTGNRRPVEEKVIHHPFGPRSSFEYEAGSGIDGEDVWEALQAYGSSDGPQDLPGMRDYEDIAHSDGDTGIVQGVEGMVTSHGEIIQDSEQPRMTNKPQPAGGRRPQRGMGGA